MAAQPPNPLANLVTGYPQLAGKMGLLPEIAMFRTFSAMNARNLLYFQAELVALEKRLLECEAQDSLDPSRSDYAVDWDWLDRSKDGNGQDAEQYRIVQKMHQKLNEYNHALIQASTLARMQQPDEDDIKYIQGFLCNDGMGDLALIGDDNLTWGCVSDHKSYASDLIALRARQTEDPFSKWVTKDALPTLLRCGLARYKKKSRVYGDAGWEESRVFRLTSWITSVVASLVPISSILILHTIGSMRARLGVIAGFNLLISFCVSTFTDAKRAEIFAVTAAFAAVQVVFVGTEKAGSK